MTRNALFGVPHSGGNAATRQLRAGLIQDSTIPVFWAPGQPSLNNTRLGDFLGYTPPAGWPKVGAPLTLPQVVIFRLAMPVGVISNARNTAWEGVAADVQSSLGSPRNFYVLPTVGLSPFSFLGFSYQELTPQSFAVDGGFLGTDVLEVVIYQDFGGQRYGADYGTQRALEAEGNAYTACGTVRATDSWQGNGRADPRTQAVRDAQQRADTDYFQRAHPQYRRHAVRLYYDRGPLVTDSAEVGIIAYNLAAQDPAAPAGQYRQKVYVNDDVAKTPPFVNLIGTPSKVTFDYENLWSEASAFQPVYLQQVASDLGDYGVVFQGTLDYRDRAGAVQTLLGEVQAHFGLSG